MQEIHHSPQWLAAVDRLYEAVGREQRLAQALGVFRPFFEAQSVWFLTTADAGHPNTTHTGAVGLSDRMLVEYHTHYCMHDEWVNAAVKRSDFATGAVYRGTELVDPRQLESSYFGRQFLARHGIVDVLGAVVETHSTDGPASFVAFQRHRGAPSFLEPEARALAALAPHMRQVLRLHRRLAPRLAVGATLREVVQRLETPLIFVAADGRIVERNPAAEAALQSPHGCLRERRGRLVVAESGRWQTLASWLPMLRNDAKHGLALDLVDDEQRPSTLAIHPLEGAVSDHGAVAICSLVAGPRDRADELRRRFGLSAAEARIAVRLAEGGSVDEIAAAMHVSLSTVRSHIAAVRGKLGVRRQAQIVSAVLEL